MPALVDKNLCNTCEECVDACPTEAISIVDGKAFVEEDECTDCEACVEECPEDAISMVD